MRFGRLIGAGQAGYVFQNMDNPKHYYKLVALPRYALSEYPVRSLDRKLYAVNSMQAQLFQRLSQSGNQPESLPKVYSFVTGNTDPSLRRQLIASSEAFDWDDVIDDLLRDFRTGQPYAIWEMEAIPCTDVNDYCQKYDVSKVSPLDNSDYQDLLRYLLSQGFVVRDIRNPENFGFRSNGSQVFFDPVVAPWPVDSSDSQQLAAFTGTFGNDLVTVERAIESGNYFNWYHGQAVMQSEEESTEPQITTFTQLLPFWNKAELYIPDLTIGMTILEQLVEWENKGIDITKYPQYVEAMNWIENQDLLANEMLQDCSKVLKQIWIDFVDFWDYEFGEIWYAEQGMKRPFHHVVSPIFEVFVKDFTLKEAVMPMTTILFRIVNDPAARQELIDYDLDEEILDKVYQEQVMIRELMLNSGKGNMKITDESFYKWIRKHTRSKFGRMKPLKAQDWILGPSGKQYLRDFSPPKSIIDYEYLYDGRSKDEVAELLSGDYDTTDLEITWNIYHS